MPHVHRQVICALSLAAVALLPAVASAQTFVVEAAIEQLTILDDTGRVPYRGGGLAARARVGSRIDLGLGVSRLSRRDTDRVLLVKAQVSADLGTSPTTRAAVPFIALSAGLMNQTLTSRPERRTSQSLTVDVTAGIRLRLGSRWFLAPWGGVGVTAYPYRRLGISGGLGF